ncbi:Rho guanine nucleotide exchange factor 1 [Bienertia sinuspersici]
MLLYMLYPIILVEILLIIILLFRNPLRKILLKGLSKLKLGRGPVVAQTLSTTLVVLFLSSLYGLFNVHKRLTESGFTPIEQVLMVHQLLETTLLGISLFLALIIDRLHYYMNEIRRLRKRADDYELQGQKKKEQTQD